MTEAKQALLPVTQADVEAALATFDGGLVRQNDERNARGYTTFYHPKDSMRAVLEEFSASRQSHSLPGDVGQFSQWSTEGLAAQCRMQARDQLDPEFIQFMTAVADRLAALTPSALSGDAGEGELPADVRRLVIAARDIAFNDWDGDSEEWAVARKELDDASEAFASRVPWENE